MFQFSYDPSNKLWKEEVDNMHIIEGRMNGSIVTKKPKEKGTFLFIRMELCERGDLETYIKEECHDQVLHETCVLSYFFQMVYALYIAKYIYHMRHYDIKLLNFFVKEMTSSQEYHSDDVVNVIYTIDSVPYTLTYNVKDALWMKLADYGTSDLCEDNIGLPVTFDHYNTIENTPLELLIGGNKVHYTYIYIYIYNACVLTVYTQY